MSTYITELRNGSASQMSAVEFWSGSVNQYPSLSPLAVDLIHAPASEAYAERVFSVCGDLTTGNRTATTLKRRVHVFLKIKQAVFLTCCRDDDVV